MYQKLRALSSESCKNYSVWVSGQIEWIFTQRLYTSSDFHFNQLLFYIYESTSLRKRHVSKPALIFFFSEADIASAPQVLFP